MSSASVTTEKDQLEILKLRAEIEKAQAERDKVFEELRQSRGLFARLGKFFTPLVATLTIIFGYLAATHSQRAAEADLKVAKAELEKQRLEAEEMAAQHDLADAKARLADTNERIVEANTAREKAETAEKSTQDSLLSLKREFANLQNEQAQRITLGNLRKLIDILDSEPPERQTADSRYIEDIRKEVAGDGQYREARIAYLTKAAQSNGLHPGLRGLLNYSLFQVNDDNQWLDQIRRLASQNLLVAWPTYSSLMELKYFDSKDRADAMCSSYAYYMRQRPEESNALLARMHFIQEYDLQARLRCRAPYFDNLEYFRSKFPPPDSEGIRLRIADPLFPPGVPIQASLIWFFKAHPELGRAPNDRETPNRLAQLQVPPDVIELYRQGSATQWLEQHKRLVDAWTTNGFPGLADTSDTTMKKILFNEWITEADLP